MVVYSQNLYALQVPGYTEIISLQELNVTVSVKCTKRCKSRSGHYPF